MRTSSSAHAILLLLVGACGPSTPDGSAGPFAPGAGAPGTPGIPAPPGSGPPGVPPSFCDGSGPIIDLGASTPPPGTPAGSCDRDTFAAALCSCSDLVVKGFVAVGSIDPSAPTAGSVGVNRGAEVLGYADVGGSVRVAGAHPLGFHGYLRTGADLEAAGDVAVADAGFAAGYMQVDGDARVGGDLALLGYATIAGDLTQPAGRATPIVLDVGGARVAAPVHVDPPCACADAQLPDLGGLVADARQHNDNATIGLAPGALRDVLGVGAVTLPCGHYYLDELSGRGFITLNVTGRVALFVGGDVAPTGLLVVQTAPGAELDLVVGGTMRSTGAGALGRWDDPGATRIYVAGGGDVNLTGASGFAGNLYAPRATVRAPGATFVRGSLFAGRIDVPGFLSVGYDPSVRGDACGPIIE